MFRKVIGLIIIISMFLIINCMAEEEPDNIYTNDRATVLELGAWYPSVTGSIKTGNANRVDFVNDLGLANSGSVVAGFKYNITFDTNIQFSYFSLENTSTRQVPNAFWWKFRNFNANDIVASTLKVKMFEALYEKNWFKTEESELNFALGGKYTYFGIGLNDVTQNLSIGQSYKGIIPVIGISGRTKMLDNMDGVAKMNFMAASSGGSNGRVIDMAAGLRWKFYSFWSADLDYRWFQFFGQNSADLSDVNINYGGPMLLIRAEY